MAGYKRFSKKLYNANDPKSREVAKKFFKKRGILLKDNENKYAVDLVADDGTLYELEHRNTHWKSGKFPFDTVNIPLRKSYLVKGDVCYCIFSEDYSTIGIIKPKVIAQYIVPSTLQENKNKFEREDEFFYKVPTEEWDFFDVRSDKKI